jgi:long-chain acyl-CoA synthetase
VCLSEPFIPPAGASRDREPNPVLVDDTAIASILFTSGTTVSPKAVPLTHRNLISNATALLRVQPIHPSDEMLSVLPIHHAFEFTGGFLVPMVCGATVTYVEQLKGAAILGAMQATGTTIMLAVPRLLKMFHDSIENGVAAKMLPVRLLFRLLGKLSDWSRHRLGRRLFGSVHQQFGGHIRMLVSGGSSLDPQLFRSFSRMGFPVYEGYGLTETSPVLTVNPPGGAKLGSVGPPLPNIELDVRNKNNDGVGEIWARGPSVMAGYLDNTESTDEIITDGWIHTGDLGWADGQGYIFLTGRSKDLIVTPAGKNVYPDEVETRYKDVPYVKEFCVFGLPIEVGLGDAVHAVAVVDEAKAPELDRSSIEREIRGAVEAISAELPSHQRVSALHLWYRELPKTSTLKARRGVIREMVVSGSGGGAATTPAAAVPSPAAESKDEVFAAIQRIIGRQAKRPEASIHRDMHLLLDLGIDSIGKVDLIGEVESQFRMHIEDEQAGAIARVSDLIRLVGRRTPTSQQTWPANVWQRIMSVTESSGENGHESSMLAPARWLVRNTVTAFMHSYIRVETHGLQHLPVRGAFIIAANHSSHLDAPAVLTAAGGSRRIWVAGAQDYFFDSAVKRFVFGKLLDTIAFDRHADGVAGLRRCGSALAGGDGLLMFPEGTRSRNGRMQPFKVGVAVLAMEHGVPIVPAYIEAAAELLPKGSRFVRSGVVKVLFGKPIAPPQLTANLDQVSARQELTLSVQRAVEQLAGSRRQVA